MIVIQSPTLRLGQFQMMDALEVFGCITPAIARFILSRPGIPAGKSAAED